MSEDKITLDIVTPYGSVFHGDVDEIVAQGSEGEFGAMAQHAPFMTSLRAGRLTAKQDGQELHFFVSWGFAEIGPDKITVLADSAEKSDEIDVDRAVEAKKRAEETMKMEDDVDFASEEAALERATSRIHIVEHSSGK